MWRPLRECGSLAVAVCTVAAAVIRMLSVYTLTGLGSGWVLARVGWVYLRDCSSL